MKNRGQVNLVQSAVAVIALIAVIAFGAMFNSKMSSIGTTTFFDTATNNSGFNSTITSGNTSLTTFSGFTPLIVLVIVLALFLGLLMFVQRKD